MSKEEKMKDIRYRQIHLDFHTSKAIEGIGSKFDAEEFAQTLKDAHVDSINLFYKGTHGNFYCDTKMGKKHPNLSFYLLGEQLKACNEQGINTCPKRHRYRYT